ncbi:MAG: valine--tRNA ligase [Bacilli bacterium]|nr:valine--tRNA ligase [Bacilli bacterium]
MLEKKYESKEVEKDKYKKWLEEGYFKSGDKTKKPFTIVCPPPNVTGKLHIGHAWDMTIQDTIIRFKKMQGYDTLWLPGMDHAAIATEAKVVKKIKEEGKTKTEIGREEFLKECWKWTNEHSDIIRSQWAKLGLSLDYSKERFTLDEGLTKAVKKVFTDMYNEGLIYRGEKIINWDPVAKTALSNEEVIYKEEKSAFYHLKYKLDGSDEYIDIATTRPETLFGDTAVAVNKEDDRYKKFVGKNVILPIMNRKIPVITDEHADMTKGTGAVKITPASDPNDYEVGIRHNLEKIQIMNDDATMNENCGKYKGLTREKAREEVLKELKEKELLLKIEPITHEVGHSERTGALVEPMIKKQWFVKMRGLADRVLENQKNKDTKVNFVPPRYEKTMNHWMEITYDWCISRQLWWGHRIPAWYKEDEVYVGMEAPKEEGWTQDEDVLDTWFSSALWPFATLGWPESKDLLKRCFPNDVLVTGYDIIPFWVNRMTFQSLHLTDSRPFKDCLIHGLIRDKQGRKMSKSLGNGVDPMDVIDEYGADSLRFFLLTNSAPGMDLRYDDDKVKASWNFINKLWNASRYVLMNIENLNIEKYDKEKLSLQDKWILTEKNKLIKNVTRNMNNYNFHNAGNQIYDFTWTKFCDWYIELSKNDMNENTKIVLLDILTTILKLLHPFMPYVTEEIYSMLPIKETKSIMISTYPKYNKDEIFEKEAKKIEKAINDITSIRTLKLNNNIKKDAKVKINCLKELYKVYSSALKIKDENIVTEKQDLNNVNYKSSMIDITYYFKAEEIDETQKQKEIETLIKSVERREKLLSNQGYINNAPKQIVENEKEKLKEEKEKLKILQN